MDAHQDGQLASVPQIKGHVIGLLLFSLQLRE